MHKALEEREKEREEQRGVLAVTYDEQDTVVSVDVFGRFQNRTFLKNLLIQAQRGDAEAAYELALASLGQTSAGRGEWIEDQAEQGNSNAQYRLGISARDEAEKWKWACLAANQDHAYAQSLVGGFYRYGDASVERDQFKAYMWYSFAASNGDPRAAGFLDDLSAGMRPEDIAVAKRLATEWEPDPSACAAESISSETAASKTESAPTTSLAPSHETPSSYVPGHAISPSDRGHCAGSEDSDKPWIGEWSASSGKAGLWLSINEKGVKGDLKVGSRSFPVRGGVRDDGEIFADVSGVEFWDAAELEGHFPELKLTSRGAGSRSFRAVNGMVFRLCS